MSLTFIGSDEVSEDVEITCVYRSISRAVIKQSIRKQPGVKLNERDNGEDDELMTISVGLQLTTGAYKISQDKDRQFRNQKEKEQQP